MIQVLICDDQEIVCEGLQVILDNSPEIEVVGIAHDGEAAVEMTARLAPDLVLMDLKMPGMNGIHATRQIHNQYPAVKVLVLTTYDADEWVFDAIRSGAAGYLLKNTSPVALVAAIQDTVAGRTHVDPGVAGKLFQHISVSERSALPASEHITLEDLSEREREVLRWMAHGLSNRDIAARLFLSEGTVRNYVSAVFAKLGVSDRTQAALIAVRFGLADTEDDR
jgi:DNA-binding NarL/FixJ family response regulator